MEQDALKAVNQLGIGPQGFGGVTTALGVAIETYPTHIAGLPVAVNVAATSRGTPPRCFKTQDVRIKFINTLYFYILIWYTICIPFLRKGIPAVFLDRGGAGEPRGV